MTDNDLLMQLWHYESPEMAARLVYLADAKAAAEYQGQNSIDVMFPRLARWSKAVRVYGYRDFVRRHRRFLLVDAQHGYVATLLVREGARITVKGAYRGNWIFEVEQSQDRLEAAGFSSLAGSGPVQRTRRAAGRGGLLHVGPASRRPFPFLQDAGGADRADWGHEELNCDSGGNLPECAGRD